MAEEGALDQEDLWRRYEAGDESFIRVLTTLLSTPHGFGIK